MILREPYSTKSDIWALGCVLYELCMLKPAFTSKDDVKIAKYEPVSLKYSKSLRMIIFELLSTEENDRPAAADILKMPIV